MQIETIALNTTVVGSGAAGYAAAIRLRELGMENVAIATVHINAGTSRNAGSDKQTYYKLTLAGDNPDSIRDMARTLFDGGCTDGDNALCEAAFSAPCFLRLCDLGVPFPQNEFGEYVGYKTDHDPHARATSAGPYTSRLMTEALQRAAAERDIPVYSGLQAIRVLKDGEGQVCGLLCLKINGTGHVAFRCQNVILATGGPGGIYADSVYPHGHYGASALAFEAGAAGQNLTEWQYGMASLTPRWNVSGTYMQVLPRMYSLDQDATEREFLFDGIPNEGDALSLLFLKGYQWPFDAHRAETGSSRIDLLVVREEQLGRRVFLDFRHNPGCKELDFSILSDEARSYLNKAGAAFGTPIERLLHMNTPAVNFYRDKGVDLTREPLEIAFCAQHCNGGVAVDANWQTRIPGLFACGEVSGTHGIRRPGGSALNETQVGAERAARYISTRQCAPPEDSSAFIISLEHALADINGLETDALSSGPETTQALWNAASVRMSRWGGAIREESRLRDALAETETALARFSDDVRVSAPSELWKIYCYRDTLITQRLCLCAMLDYLAHGGGSRGGAIYPERGLYNTRDSQIQEVLWTEGDIRFIWRPVRPLPMAEEVFENVWRAYRNR